MKIRIALTVAAAAMMPFSAFASPTPQQLLEDLTTDLRYYQHNVDDTRYHLSHPLLRHNDLGTRYFLSHPLLRHDIHPDRLPWFGFEDPRRPLEDVPADLFLVLRVQPDGNDLEPVLCSSAQAPTLDDLALLEFCEWFFEPEFVGRYSESGDLYFDGLTRDGSEPSRAEGGGEGNADAGAERGHLRAVLAVGDGSGGAQGEPVGRPEGHRRRHPT